MNIVGTLNLGVNQKLPPLCFPQSHHPVNLFPNVFCSRPSSTPIISFNTDIIQISKKILGNKSGKNRNIFSAKELLTLNILFSRKRFPPPRSKFGERIVPERTDNKRPCIFYSDHERWSPREFCCHLDPWAHLWKNCQKKEKEPVGHLCQD